MKFIKTLVAFFLMLSVFAVFLTIYVVKFNNTSPVGKSVKRYFIQYPTFVDLAGLNEPGDYRYGFSDDSYSSLQVKLVSARGVEIDESASTWIRELVEQTIHKDINIFFEKDQLALRESYSDEDLNQVRDSINEDYGIPTLYLVYVTKYEEEPGLVGITLHKDTIFIFKVALDELNENEELLDRLEQSTIMHEWAHLLGVEHTKDEGCIMSEKINVYENPDSWKGFIPIEFCSSTIRQINELVR